MSTFQPLTLPSKKEEKPTLAGVNVKTRKRNVAVPLDPAGFAEKVITVINNEVKESGAETIEAKLAAAGKAVDAADLDFSRYGDTLFEIYFAGARMGIGAKLADDTKDTIDFHIFDCEPTTEAILPFVKAFSGLLRRRPFLVQRLETVVKKLLTSLDFFDDAGHKQIAIATALMFTEKVGMLPERIFEALLNDRLVAKGTVITVVTHIFREFLEHASMDELVSLLTRGKIVHRLLDYFPPGKQTEECFAEHFKAAGLDQVVEWQAKKVQENCITELRAQLFELFQADEDDEAESLAAKVECIKEQKDSIAGEALVQVVWGVLVATQNSVGKNQQQIYQMLVRSINENLPLLQQITTNMKQELALMNCCQVSCYEDSKLLKIFVDLVKVLYQKDLVGEDTVLYWYKKGSSMKGRNVFLNDIVPFVKWLEETEEDEEDGEDEE